MIDLTSLRPMISRKFKFLRVVISVGLLIFVVYRVGLINILRTFTSLNAAYIPIIIALYVTTLILGGFKLWILLKAITNNISLSSALIYSFMSWSIGLFTPGKVGEFSLIYFLKKQGIETGKGTGVLLIDKSLTLSTLIACSGIGMLLLFHIKSILLFLLILAACLVAVYFIAFWAEKMKPQRIRTWFSDFRISLKTISLNNSGLLLIAFLLAICKWCITGVAFYIVFISLGYSCNLITIIIISMTITIINIIPITLHGLGLKEMAAVHFYGLIHIPQEAAVVSSLFFSLLAYAMALTIILVFGRHFHSK